MKNFKKALAFVLVVAVAMGAGIMGTLAYLQDEDSDVNVMTLGNVSIKQHEYERVVNADGTFATDTIDGQESYVLEDFTQGKPLLPIVGDPSLSGPGYAGWDSIPVRMSQVDSYGGMSVFAGKNAQDKFVVVENDGITDAYIRTIVAIEVGSADPELISFSNHSTWTDNQHGVVTIDGNNYFIHEFTYDGAPGVRHEGGILPAGDTAYPSLCQVYIKSAATNEDMVKIDGNGNHTLDILVLSQAVQAAGFADADTALDAAFGDVDAANVAAWLGKENVPVTVFSAEELKDALEAGETDIVVKGAEITENFFNGHYYKDRNIDFIDCTFNANMNYMYINDATFTNCTFDCGSANAAVHYDELFGDLVFNNCTFKSGKIQIGANKDMTGTVTFNDCVFEETTSTSIWSEKGIRVYSPAEFNNCEFNNRVVMAGSNGLPITFNSCTMNGGCPVYYVDNTDGIIRGGNIPAVTVNNEKATINVTTAAELEEAFANAMDGDIITLANDITGNVKLTQQAGVKVAIYGNGKTFNGVMTVFGNGRKATAGLTIKGINFVAANGAASCIVSPDRSVNNAYSYSSNVTVEGCTFTDPDGVVNCAAVRHEDGGDTNWKIIDCVVDNTMHSLVQVNNVEHDGLLIQGCKVNSKNGINLNQCTKVSIIDCEIDVLGYTVRFGVNGSTVNGTFEIKDSTLKSANDDGDAVIIFRGEMSGSTLTITNTTLTGTPEFTGNASVVIK